MSFGFIKREDVACSLQGNCQHGAVGGLEIVMLMMTSLIDNVKNDLSFNAELTDYVQEIYCSSSDTLLESFTNVRLFSLSNCF